MSLLLRTTVLGGATPLCHHIVQLITFEQDRKEVYLPLRLCLSLLHVMTKATLAVLFML